MTPRRPWYKQVMDTVAVILVGFMTLGSWAGLVNSYASGSAGDAAFLVVITGALTYWLVKLVREVLFLWGYGSAPETRSRRSV